MYIIISQKIDTESLYEDKLYEIYHFPRRYANQIKEGDIFLYYQGDRYKKDNRYYFGTGVVGKIESEDDENYYAKLKYGKKFENKVPIYVTSIEVADGIDKYLESLGYLDVRNSPIPPWQRSIRPISEAAYNRILSYAGRLIGQNKNLFKNIDINEIGVNIENDDYEENIAEINFCEVEPPMEGMATMHRNGIIAATSPEKSADKAKKQKKLGDIGEKYVVEIEKRRLTEMKREDLLPLIEHVASKKDGLGYDIISVDVDETGKEQEIYIEVKTTKGNKETPFEVSVNEVEVSKRLSRSYYIYRLFGIKKEGKRVDYYKIKGAIDDNFQLEIVKYRTNGRRSK